MKRPYFHLAVAVVVTALLAPLATFAQSPELQSAADSVAQSVDQLAESKDIASLRKALLNIFDLSLAEIQTLQQKLRVIRRDGDKELVTAKDKFEADLTAFFKFVETQKTELGFEASTKDSITRRAANFKAWREKIYDPEIKDIFDLFILLQGKTLVATANGRLAKISSDVDKLKVIYGVKADGLDIFLDQASTHLKAAAVLEQEAHLLFVKNFSKTYFTLSLSSPESFFASVLESLNPKTAPAETEVPAEEEAVASEEEPVVPETVQSLIQESVSSVREAYKVFLEMIDFARLKKFIP